MLTVGAFLHKGCTHQTMSQNGDIRREIALRMTILARRLRNDFDSHVGAFGLTRSQWSLIAVVASRPGATQRTIAELLEMSEVSAGRLVDRLVIDGLLQRREREDDRRARAVYLTAKADPLLETMSDYAQLREQRMFRGMSDEQLDRLRELLDVVYTNFNPEHKGS